MATETLSNIIEDERLKVEEDLLFTSTTTVDDCVDRAALGVRSSEGWTGSLRSTNLTVTVAVLFFFLLVVGAALGFVDAESLTDLKPILETLAYREDKFNKTLH